jgi:cardiolipin synthase
VTARRSALIFFLTFFFILADAQEKIIVEPDAGRKPILNVITDAKNSVDMVIYGFTDKDFANALISAQDQHKHVRVLIQHHPYRYEDENQPIIDLLQSHGIVMTFPDQNFKLTHQKTLITDEHGALVMTFNLTHSTFRDERNFALLIDDPAEVKEIEAVYNADWQHKFIQVSQPDLVWSPDNSREKILALIHSAKHDIMIYAEGLTDYSLVGALASAGRNGVNVRILTTLDAGKKPGKQFEYMERAGVQIRLSKNLVIHAKVIMVDNQKALLGSINLTKPSINDNRELAVITHTPEILAVLQKTFASDWDNANQSSLPFTAAHNPHYTLNKSVKELLKLAHLQHSRHRHRKYYY